MEARERRLLYYIAEDGSKPFLTWLERLGDRSARARVLVRLDRVRDGNMGDAKGVGGGVMELRVPYGPGYRIYFGEDGPVRVILLCGGDKRTQGSDISKAKRYWEDYLHG